MHLRKLGRPVIDSTLLAILLVGSNVAFGGELGWIKLNPSPYLLLPLLIGGKYGVRSGLGAGLLAVVVSLALACIAGRSVSGGLEEGPLLWLAMPLAGLLSGELRRQAVGRREELEVQNVDLRRSKEAFEKDLDLARESQHLLQRELSLYGADACSLDIELRKIFDPGEQSVLGGTLAALGGVAGLTDAAFYLLDGQRQVLARAEFVGDPAYFPDEIGMRHTKMAWTAIEAGELVTCRGLGSGRGDVGKARFLAALPWRRDGEVAGVLLVHDMPFLSMNWQTLARIELVCDWVSAMADMRERAGGKARDGAVDLVGFQSMLGMAGRSLEEQGLPSAIALITAVGALTASEMRDAIEPQLRSTDVAVAVEERALAVLLPLEAGRDAEAAAGRYLAALSGAGKEASVRLWTMEEPMAAERLWDEIVRLVS